MSEPLRPRERILEAAIALLDSEGETGIKVDHLAEVAQVGKQSIYHHFGDRDGLIVAAQGEQYRRSILTGLDVLQHGLVDCVTVDEYAKLLLLVAAAATSMGKERRRVRAQAIGSAATRPALQAAIRDAHRQSVAALAKIFDFGKRRGWITDTYSATTLGALWFDWISGRHVSENYAVDDDNAQIGRAHVDAISLILFGRTYPEFNSPPSADTVAKAAQRVMEGR